MVPALIKALLRVIASFLILLFLPTSLQQAEVPLFAQRPPTIRTEVVITAVGDVMMPMSIQRAVAQHRYDYDILFEKIAPDLNAGDILFANLEAPVDERSPASGYPRFNGRLELLTALKKAGVGIVSVANNHAIDAGAGGLVRTLDNIESAGIRFIGAGRTKEEADKIASMTIRGIRIGFLAYTYDTNERLPKRNKDAPGVNVLRSGSDEDLVRAADAVRKTRTAADLVVVSLHWGEEYRTTPTSWQRRTAIKLIESGADIILGHHPHVLQPIESYSAYDGRQGLIVFSLGNFMASQNAGITNLNKAHARALRGDGIILNIVVMMENGKAVVKRAEFLPTWTLRDRVGTTVVSRPVSLAREIARLETILNRTLEEEKTLELLSFRKQAIAALLTVNPPL